LAKDFQKLFHISLPFAGIEGGG